MKRYIEPSQRVGISEAGEIAFNLDAFDRLYRANVIITKSLTDKLIDKLIRNKDKIILHVTCTGYGGTQLEPFVPTPEKTHAQVMKLVSAGFPVSHIVLRIDPIIPTAEGRKTAYNVAALFSDIGIWRLRFSVLDMYKHVAERMKKVNFAIPYYSFHASEDSRMTVLKGLQTIGTKYGYEIESCGEPGIISRPCVSQKDIDILGLKGQITLSDSAEQRKTCACPANKSELIRNGKPHRCQNQCLYCFWKDDTNA